MTGSPEAGIPGSLRFGHDGGIGLTRPHHDGSALYVSTETPRLGDRVTVWLRVPDPPAARSPYSAAYVRVVRDGEPRFVAAVVDADRTTAVETWWRADLECHNRVTSYRWLLAGGPVGWLWVDAAGGHLRDVPDAANFRIVAADDPLPQWPLDAIVYQIFPDRFARSASAAERPTPEWAVPARWDDPVEIASPAAGSRQFFGGDLDGITEHLDHVAALGADVVYLTPIFPGRSNHRYDAHTFDAVDPTLGGDAALRRLTTAAHERGIRVLGDFTSNHTGVTHEWFVAARADATAPERAFYFFDPQGRYAAWLDVPSLPKLDHASPELRRRLFEDPRGVVQRWLGPDGGLDGWRVDVANMTGRHREADLYHDVARRLRAASVAANPQALVVAEHCHDTSTDLTGDGWHGVMNYAGFTRPVWTWLTSPDNPDAPSDFLGQPVRVPRLPGELVADTMLDVTSRIPWASLVRSFTLLGSHDTSRIRTLVGGDLELVRVAAGLLFTIPGIPMVTYGDEIGMRGRFGEDGRRPMPWPDGEPRGSEPWEEGLLAAYREFADLRRRSVALRRGGLRWVYAAGDALVFLREAPGESALVHVARAAHAPIELDVSGLPGIMGGRTDIGDPMRVGASTLTLAAERAQVSVRVWASGGADSGQASPSGGASADRGHGGHGGAAGTENGGNN